MKSTRSRTAAAILAALLVAGLGSLVFSWWVLNTQAGRSAFDEMAGMIPFAAGPFGLLLLLAAAIVWWRSGRA